MLLRKDFLKPIKKTLRMKIIIAASLFAIIPVSILGTSAYLVADYSLRQEVNAINRQTILQIQNRIDEKLKDLNKLAIQITLDSSLEGFLTSVSPATDFVKHNEVVNTLYSVRMLNDDIESIYLCFRNLEYVVYSSKTGNGLSMDLSILDQPIRDNIHKINKYFAWMDRKKADGTHAVTLIRTVPNLSLQPYGYLIVDINEDAFFRILEDVRFGVNGEISILTPSGNVFTNTENSIIKNDPEAYRTVEKLIGTEQKENLTAMKIGGRKMMISYIVSPYNNWKYITITPYSEFSHHIQDIKNITIGICIFLIMLSFVSVLMISGRFYRVVQGLLDIIRKKDGSAVALQDKADEIGLIKNYVKSLQDMNDTLTYEINQSKPLLKISFLQRLLTENIDSGEIEEKLSYYGIETCSRLFTVMCLEIDRLKQENEKDANLYLFAVSNIAEELSGNYGKAFVVKMQSSHIAVIFNHHNEDNRQTKVFRLAEEIRDIAGRLLHITVTIGIGRCYEGPDRISESYREALEALQYQLVEGSGAVIFIGQIKSEKQSFSYPFKIEHLLISNMKMGNLEQVQKLVEDFSVYLKGENAVSYDNVQQSFFQLVATSLKALYDIDMDSSMNLFSYNVYQHLTELKTMDKIVSWLKQEFYPVIVKSILSRRGQRNREVIDKALDYIHNHFNEDLSQYIMAEVLSIPTSHFSKIFKEEVGMTFTDYVITYRMEKAKEFLVNTDMKIGDIAAYLRYNNSQNFIRVFKQITGMTPANYRLCRTEAARTNC